MIPEVGPLDGVWTLLILIVPGFLTFKIITWLGSYDVQLDQFVTTIYSLICSIIVFIPISYAYNLKSYSDINLHITEQNFLISFLFVGIIVGVIPGLFLRFIFRKYLRCANTWEGFAKDFHRKSIMVYTADDKVYVGWVKRMSIGKDEKRELSIGKPKLVIKDEKGNKSLRNVGNELLFTEDNIRRLLRYKDDLL